MANSQNSESLESVGMYLASLSIKNFRSCVDVCVDLQPDLTVLVGENNSGKTNVVDAARLVVGPLSGKRSRYFEPDDVSDTATDRRIELAATFDGLTKTQRGLYATALDLSNGKAHYSTVHTDDQTLPVRLRTQYLAGKVPGPDAEPENRAKISHVYLPPLRDAQRALDSASGTRLLEIIKHLVPEVQQKEFLAEANHSLKQAEKHPAVKDTAKYLRSHLGELTKPVRGQDVGLSFQDMKLHRLVRGLRMKMAEEGVELADISQSGLGYANLLYMATVILELQNAQQNQLTLFLVEEPEAHLHPQLQKVLLEYLREKAQGSINEASAGQSGRIQIIATTHSPNIASGVGISNIVALRSKPRASEQDGGRETAALPLAKLELTADERRKIDQYLDVTRSELLFGQRAVLVEGIAEAVLLPVLAKHTVFTDSTEAGPDQHRAFHAISVINVGSVDFAPYITLLAKEINGVRLVDKLAVITDGDPELKSATTDEDTDEVDDEEDVTAYNRESDLRQLIASLDASAAVDVFPSRYTLEADLLEPVKNNQDAMRTAFLMQKPRSRAAFDRFVAAEQPAEVLYHKLRTTKKYLAKGQFAHDLALLIEKQGGSFICPGYLVKALHWIVS